MGRVVEREVVFLDTHVVIWLYQGKKIFSNAIREKLSHADLRISPMVRFELALLHEKKRIEHPYVILSSLKRDFYFSEDKINFSEIISSAFQYSFTRDPFDRLIVAHAKARNCKLVSKDQMILDNFSDAIW